MRFPHALAASASGAVLCWALAASADAPAGSTELPPPDDPSPNAVYIPDAPDTRAGHVQLAAAGGAAWPLGRLDSAHAQSSLAGGGFAGLVDLGYGISRSLVVGLWGELDALAPAQSCSRCSARGFGFGPLLRYHVVQGTRFDPWLSLGMGLRALRVQTPSTLAEYSGIDWARLELGGDWYASPNFGLGPYADLSLGVYAHRPDDLAAGALHVSLGVGLRALFDYPGK